LQPVLPLFVPPKSDADGKAAKRWSKSEDLPMHPVPFLKKGIWLIAAFGNKGTGRMKAVVLFFSFLIFNPGSRYKLFFN
jgi:hypothetical protein